MLLHQGWALGWAPKVKTFFSPPRATSAAPPQIWRARRPPMSHCLVHTVAMSQDLAKIHLYWTYSNTNITNPHNKQKWKRVATYYYLNKKKIYIYIFFFGVPGWRPLAAARHRYLYIGETLLLHSVLVWLLSEMKWSTFTCHLLDAFIQR